MKTLLLILSITLCATLSAQQGDGIIKGCIIDSLSKEEIPFIIVLLTDSSNHTQAVYSDLEGKYQFGSIPLGSYSLSIKPFGTKPEKPKIIEIISTQPVVVNFSIWLKGIGPCFEPPYAIDVKENPSSNTYRRDEIIHMAVPR